jgi:uncharacterized coiled-coil DUF342 family protein
MSDAPVVEPTAVAHVVDIFRTIEQRQHILEELNATLAEAHATLATIEQLHTAALAWEQAATQHRDELKVEIADLDKGLATAQQEDHSKPRQNSRDVYG